MPSAYSAFEDNMLHAEETLSSFRIFATAVADWNCPGFRAAAVVLRLDGHGLPVDVAFRDTDLDDGRVWAEPGEAVRFGLEVGEAAVRALSVVSRFQALQVS